MMGKRIIWECDLCGLEVQANPENNAQVAFVSTQGGRVDGSVNFDAIICDDCTAKKDVVMMLNEVVEAGKRSTAKIEVASITFRKFKSDNTLVGVPVKSVSAEPS
jgi:hypothetical protein